MLLICKKPFNFARLVYLNNSNKHINFLLIEYATKELFSILKHVMFLSFLNSNHTVKQKYDCL